MKAIVMERYGTPDRLHLREVAQPVPEPHEVLVRMRAAAVNDWDAALLAGDQLVIRVTNGFFTPKTRILGSDVAGEVEAVGEGVTGFQPGDHVYGDLCYSGFGAFAEYVCAPESCLIHKPTGMTFEEAAAIPQAGMLAVQGLIDLGRVRSGQKILLNGAGGGVGTFALQIAKQHDVHLTVVDKANKLDMLRELGADQAIDYLSEDFTRRGERYDLILDTKTNRSPSAYMRALLENGVYVTVGGPVPRLLQLYLFAQVVRRTSGYRLLLVGLKPNKDLAYMNALFEAGKMKPVLDGPFRLANVPEAFRYFGTGDYKGKIIITMP